MFSRKLIVGEIITTLNSGEKRYKEKSGVLCLGYNVESDNFNDTLK